jgi:hypothetical protein
LADMSFVSRAALALCLASNLGCALFHGWPSEHAIWTRAVEPSKGSASPNAAPPLKLELDNELEFARVRGVAMTVDGALVRREFWSGGEPGADYETTVPVAANNHEICVYVLYEGIDVLAGHELLVTAGRVVESKTPTVKMKVHTELVPGAMSWGEMVKASWTGGRSGPARKRCESSAAVIDSDGSKMSREWGANRAIPGMHSTRGLPR